MAVITGVNGFVGRHVAREFAAHGFSVVGISRDPKVDGEIESSVNRYVSADLAESWPDVGPADVVIHLAGLAAVGPSFDDPQHYIDLNSSIVTNLCEHFLTRDDSPHARIIGVSSGAVYGSTHNGAITETTPPHFSSPYAVSKVLIESQFAYYAERGLDCVVTRPFNHIGPGQGMGFIVPDLIAAVRAAKEDGAPVRTGNLATIRDYTDVRDVATAYRLLATATVLNHRTYNVCSGIGTSGQSILELVVAQLDAPHTATATDGHARPTDPSVVVGDHSRLTADTGWTLAIPIVDSIRDAVAAS